MGYNFTDYNCPHKGLTILEASTECLRLHMARKQQTFIVRGDSREFTCHLISLRITAQEVFVMRSNNLENMLKSLGAESHVGSELVRIRKEQERRFR